MVKQVVNSIGGEVPTNGAYDAIEVTQPYVVNITIKGVADLLFHRWNCEEVEAKGKAAKGSKAKKTDNVESYVYRNDKNELCIPGEYVRQSIIHAAKYRQDPRSPRKSAMDLYKAGIVSLTLNAPVFGAACRDLDSQGMAGRGVVRPDKAEAIKTWDYLHQCRVTIQRNGITRSRPALKEGWQAEFQIMVNLPEYIRPNDLHDVLVNAGRLIGLADFRPTYGRFSVVSYDIGLE